jgi:hypothetical protein
MCNQTTDDIIVSLVHDITNYESRVNILERSTIHWNCKYLLKGSVILANMIKNVGRKKQLQESEGRFKLINCGL